MVARGDGRVDEQMDQGLFYWQISIREQFNQIQSPEQRVLVFNYKDRWEGIWVDNSWSSLL